MVQKTPIHVPSIDLRKIGSQSACSLHAVRCTYPRHVHHDALYHALYMSCACRVHGVHITCIMRSYMIVHVHAHFGSQSACMQRSLHH